MRKGAVWLLALVLLATGCGRRQKSNEQPPAAAKTQQAGDRGEPAGAPDVTQPQHGLHTDTATRTDARLFGRKEATIYSARQLCGKWVMGPVYECYYADGTGKQWDTSEDVDESEAQTFRWTLDSNLLHEVYSMTAGGVVPRDYVVTYADDESLVYKDAFGNAYMWDRAE